MEENYLQELYDWISATDKTFVKREPFEEWSIKVGEDTGYAQELYDWISSVDKTFAKREPFEEWSIKVKKKDNSQPIGEEEVMVSDTEVVEQPGSSVPSATSSEQPEVIQEEVTTEASNLIDPNEVVDETEDGASYINLEGGGDDDEILDNATMGEQNTAIERTFGKNEFTDFFGDMYRAGAQGQAQGDVVDNALEIFGKGTSASDQDIEEFIIAHNAMAASGPSQEMKDFDRVYESAGGGIFGFIKGLIESPSVAPQLFVSSMSAMVNPASLAAAGATTAGFTGVGAMAGGIGAVPGAIASIPFAMGAAGATLETGLSFAEFLNEELKEKGLKFTREDVKKVLNDPDAMLRIRAKAAGRGAVIGIVDRYTAGLGGKLVGGMVKSGAKKGARILAASGVEAVGGSAGEAAARLTVGQQMDVKEIGFEGIAGMSTTPVTYAYGTLLAKPTFKVNNGVVDRATILEMINTPDDEAFAGMKLEIKNDPELLAIAEARKNKLRQESGIVKQLKEAGITDEAAITELTALEREKQALEGNTTRAGKLKLKEIDAKIDAIMDQEVTEEIEVTEDELATQDSDSVKRETYETINDDGNKVIVQVTTAKDGSRIVRYKDAEGTTYQTETFAKDNDITNEKIIELNVAEEGGTITNTETIEGFENIANPKAVAKRKQELKTKQDAIQESSTEKVDVQVQTEDGRAVGDGDTQTTITEESSQEKQTDLEAPTQEEIDIESRDLETFLNDNDVVTEETEVTTNEIVDEAPGQIVNDNLTITEKTTTENDGHYNSEVFVKENPNTTVDQHENKIISLAKKATKAITKILPDTKIVIHRSEDAYNKFVTGKGSRGTFDPNTNTIHINMPKANAKTIAHEIFHAVLYNKYSTDIKIAEVTKRMVDAIKRKVTDKKLKQQLDDFSDQYTEFQNEEYLSELVGILADNYPSLSAPEKSLVKRWLQKVAKMLKIDALIDTDADVLDLLNTIGKSVKEGKEITTAEVKQLDMFEGGQQVDNPSAALKEHKVGGFEVTYTENEKITQYIKDGRITQPENLESFRGNKTAITSPDDMVVGEIFFEGEKIFEGQGGLFFVTKFGDVWAAGDKTTATKLADMINKSVDANGGKGYLTLTKGTDKKLISSAAGVNSSLGIIDVLLNKNILPKAVVRTAVNKVIKDFGGGNVNLTGSSKQMISQLRKFFGDKKNATFEARGTVMERIITEIGMDKRLGDLKKKDSKLTKILGGDIYKTLVGGKTSKTANSLVDLIASLAAEDITKGLNTGDIYGVIEVDGKVEYYPGDHPSYPAHIRQVNGNPPVLHLPKDRPPAKNYLMRDSNKIYKTPAVSPTEYGSFYEKADSKVTDTDIITQEDIEILYPKQRQQKVDITEAQVQEALKTDKTAQRIIAKGITPKQGEKVGVRLNLNVLKNKGVPIQTVHQGQVSDKYKRVDGKSGFFGGEAINYAPAVTLKDVYLNTHQKSIYEVKNKIKNKFPLASVDGKFQDIPFDKQNLKGTELRFNPFNTQLFETLDGKPVRFVEEATVLGTRVFARGKIEYFTEANKPKPYTPEKSTKQRQQLSDGYFIKETGQGQFTLMKGIRNAGDMSIAELQSDKPSVSQVYIKKFDQGKGLAPDMYREVAKAMEAKGKTLVSSKYTNDASQGVWKRLVKDGDAIVIGSRIDSKGKKRNRYEMLPSNPKQRQQKGQPTTMAKLMNFYKMDKDGFIEPKNVYDLNSLDEWAAKVGYRVDRSRGDRGETTKYYLREKQTDKKYTPTKAQRQQVADVLNKDMDVVEIITIARDNNFRGPAIKDYLVRVKKMKVKDVVDLLKVPVDIFSNVPEAFTNIKEGMNEGVKLYTDIIEKSKKWQTKNKATDAKTFDKAVQFLEESKVFKNQADPKRKGLSTLQKEMIVGMQKSLGVRPMKNTNLKLRVLRQSLKDTKRGAKELKSVQSKLRNFIRRSLPPKQYTKGEITTLISDVTNATEANIDNLIQKVIDKITTIQVADLETTIDKLLNDQYEKIESGREKGKKISVDVNDRLKALKKDMVTDSMVADDVVKRNLELNQEFNEITNKSEQLSEGDLNRLMDLAVLINLNNATLMNNTDVNKVESLNQAAELLTQIVGRGKELFKAQLKKDHQKYVKNKETLYEQVTGEKIDMSDPEQVAKAKKAETKGKARKNKRASEGLLKKSVRGLQLALSSFFKGSESLSGLMNIIDRLPGELIGGKVREMVYGKLNESTRVYKERKKGNKQIIEAKLKEIFGKKWKSGISAMRKPIDWSDTKEIWIDEKEVNEAELAYDKDPTRKNKLKLKKVKEENTIVMSQDEILYQYQQFQDPANLPSFMNEDNFLYRGDPKRILESLMEQVDPKNKEVSDWLVEEFYPSLYEHYNKTYKAIYRTNLPWNDKYAGRIYREASAPNPLIY